MMHNFHFGERERERERSTKCRKMMTETETETDLQAFLIYLVNHRTIFWRTEPSEDMGICRC